MINKDLGMVTAYAYAVSKGYAGTEEQFATLMASYADVGQTAVDAALAAKASEDAAKASETAAGASETAAATSAGTAATAAQNASESATTASGKATEATTAATAAAGSATTAGNKATEAAQSATAAAASATAAESAKTAAQAAQTAAETAQTAAETAQGAAEDAAESVSASAAQIAQNTADISSVKNALGATLITDTASGAIATFTDGADNVPMRSVVVDMEPIQDLHGQASPYPAGGGAQLLNPANYEATTKTLYGVTYTVNDDGSISASGTATATSNFFLASSGVFTVEPGTYTLAWKYTGIISGSGLCNLLASGGQLSDVPYTSVSVSASTRESSTTFTASVSGSLAYVQILIPSGFTVNCTFYPIILKGSTYTAWSPYSNICPISGRSEVGVTRAGKNLLENASDSYSISGTTYHEYSCPLSLLEGETVTFSLVTANMQGKRIALYKGRNANNVIKVGEYGENHLTATLSGVSGYDAIRMYLQEYTGDAVSISGAQLEIGSTATAYQAYTASTYTLPLGQTVYGGTVDAVSGVMTVDRAMVDLGSLTWTQWSGYTNLFRCALMSNCKTVPNEQLSNWICSDYLVSKGVDLVGNGYTIGQLHQQYLAANDPRYSDAATFTTAMNGVQLCYELTQPVTVQLNPRTLTTLLGVNNVWSDGGDVSVEYVADTKAYIAKVIAAALA